MKTLFPTLYPVYAGIEEAKTCRSIVLKSFIALPILVVIILVTSAATAIAQNATEPCFEDNTAADFKLGNPGTSTYISKTEDGEVMLKPAAGAEFSELPPTSEWNSFPWATGGSAAVSNDSLFVNGSRFNSEPEGTAYGPGTSIEFVATFGAAVYQHIGFSGGTDAIGTGGMFNGDYPWAMFSTSSTDNTLFARTLWSDNSSTNFAIQNIPDLIGTPHKFRIDWKADGSFEYFVDGSSVWTAANPNAATIQMRPGISDYKNDGVPISVDWIRVTPFANSGTFVSRINDAGSAKNWGSVLWISDVPGGTTLAISVREGNSPAVDQTWTPYSLISSSGNIVGGSAARYIQYKAELSTSNPNIAPVLKDISFSCNTAPVLDPIGSKEVSVGQMLSFTATATDPESQSLTFSLINGPDGAGIDANTGAFSWTSGSTGSFTFTVRVTDNGSPVLSDQEDITVTVPNHAPVLASIGDKSVTAGQALTFTASASDADNGQTLTFSLINSPDGAVIDANTGSFSWTPGSVGSFPFKVRVTDNGSPVLYSEEQITVTVSSAPPPNHAPVLSAIGNKAATAGQVLTFTAQATDPDAGQTETFSLINAPATASIGSASGYFSWTPASTGSYTFKVRVTDNGSPVLSDEKEITVTVNPPNQPPVLTAIGSKTINIGQTLKFTATATDPNSGQTKTFSLINSPGGAVIGASTGAFYWKPRSTGKYTFKVRVTDNGTPRSYDEEQITVTVNFMSPYVTLTPIADAFVRNGSYSAVNYGKDPSLLVKVSPSIGSSRSSYLKFSISSVASNVSSAILRIYGRNTDNTTCTYITAFGVNNDSWSENTITWNNAPTSLSAILGTVGVNNLAKYYEIDVTRFVQSQLAGDKTVSFLIKDPSHQNRTLSFNSKENASNKPQLIISTISSNKLFPTADAYVRNGSYSGVNYGKDASLMVKGSASIGNSRASYLKFSLSSISIIKSAKLRLYGRNTENTASINISAYAVNNDFWTEGGIKWNNTPTASSTVLSTVNVNNQTKYYELDVTSFVKSQLAGDKIVSFLIKDPRNQNNNISFNSRENTQNQPQLVIETATSSSKDIETPITGLEIKTDDSENTLQTKQVSTLSKVFPNPARKIFNVELSEKHTGKVSFQLIDVTGKVHPLAESASRTSSITQIDISNLNLVSGIYFLRIMSEGGKSEIIKLVIQQ